MSLVDKGLALLKSEPENPNIIPSEKDVERLKKYVAEHLNDTGFPPKSNELAEATVKALNKLP